MRFFRGVLDKLPAPVSWLDAGAGDGWLARELRETTPHAELVCWDAFYTDEDLARLRALHSGSETGGVRFLREAPEGPFDLVTALDVLEHVEDDRGFLEGLVARLGPRGHLLFSVPAWPRLFTAHDTRLLHYRRYRPRDAAQLLEDAGLEILRGGGLFHSLLPVRVVQKILEQMRPPDTEKPDLGWNASPWVTRTILGALAADNRLSASPLGDLLPGLSYWALCTKR